MKKKHQHQWGLWHTHAGEREKMRGFEVRACIENVMYRGKEYLCAVMEARMTPSEQALWVVALSLWLKDHTAFEMVEKHEFQFCREWLRSLLDGA